MGKFLIRDSNELDYQTIVDINDVEVQYTSPMDVKRLRDLDQLSAYHRVAVVEGNIAAFYLLWGEIAHTKTRTMIGFLHSILAFYTLTGLWLMQNMLA